MSSITKDIFKLKIPLYTQGTTGIILKLQTESRDKHILWSSRLNTTKTGVELHHRGVYQIKLSFEKEIIF